MVTICSWPSQRMLTFEVLELLELHHNQSICVLASQATHQQCCWRNGSNCASSRGVLVVGWQDGSFVQLLASELHYTGVEMCHGVHCSPICGGILSLGIISMCYTVMSEANLVCCSWELNLNLTGRCCMWGCQPLGYCTPC